LRISFSKHNICFNALLGEGSHPIFAREEIIQASARASSGPVDEHHRVVAIVDEAPPIQSQGIYGM
jgi:hypothetical protein